MRMYLVEGPEDKKSLVEATSASQAVRAVVNGAYSVRIPTGTEVASLVAGGMTPMFKPEKKEEINV